MAADGLPDAGRETAERRFLTIVFVDLVGFTNLSEELDPEDLGFLLRRYQKLALSIMERYGGFVARFVGDGVLAYFGYPRAHERDAERALRAALELMQRLPETDTLHQGRTLPKLVARAGVHSGLVLMAQELISDGSSAPGIVGEAPNLAARLQAEAPPGGVLLSQETLELVEGLFEFESLGARPIKGLSREVIVHRVKEAVRGTRRTPARVQRGATRMVGRESAVERILSLWEAAREQGKCQTVFVTAEAGVGKTRLVLELTARTEFADAAILQANCHEIFASTPLYPVGNLFWSRAELTLDDDEPTRMRKIAQLLDELGLNNAEHQQLVDSLLGPSSSAVPPALAPTPQLFKFKQYEFVVAVIRQIARRRPTLLWVEDAHWLDPSSAELLQEVARSLHGEPLLVLITTRSYPAGPALPEPTEIVRLEQLDRAECLELARAVPGAEVLTEDVVAQAVQAAEGVPLFVEQLVISLLDERMQLPGRARRSGGMPLMLAEMMSERLDRLPGGRRIVQAAACIGRSFVPEFLLEVLEQDAREVAQPFEALVSAEILLPRRFGAELRYEFRHALLQRMAYESIVSTDRRATHRRIVEVLRARSPAHPTIPEVMAHHLTEAGSYPEAAQAWLQAGVTASRRSAHVEAVDHLRRGLRLLEHIADGEQRRQLELNIQVTLMASILATQSATSYDLSACCERGLALCEEGAASPLIFPFIFGEFTFTNCRGRGEEAEVLARRFLDIAARSGNDSARVIGHRMLGMVLLAQGHADRARPELEQSLDLYVPERDAATTHMFGQNTEVHTKSLLSLVLFCMGEVDAALEMGQNALRTADAVRHPHSTAIPLCYVGGWVFGLCDATGDMMRESRRLMALAEQHRLNGFRAHGAAFFGWALCQRGDLAQGIAAIEQAVAAFTAVDFRLALAGHLANLADAQRRAGRIDDARANVERAITLIPNGSRWLEPEIRRIDALVTRAHAPTEALAVDKARAALACARRLAFPVLERRCLITLRDMLGPDQSDAELEARLRELDHLRDLPNRVSRAMLPGSVRAAESTVGATLAN